MQKDGLQRHVTVMSSSQCTTEGWKENCAKPEKKNPNLFPLKKIIKLHTVTLKH